MELLNILNEKGQVIGSKDIKEIYKEGLLHGTVHVWIINSKSELLLQMRNPKKETFPGLWALSTAGHVRKDESYEEAALRELKEELNQDVKLEELDFLFKIERNQTLGKHKINTIDKVYLLKREIDLKNTKLQKSELTDIKFINYKEFRKILENNDKGYIPATEEHTKLFTYLDNNLKPFKKTKTKYTYNIYKELSIFNERHAESNITLTMIFLLLLIVGFINKNWLFYFSIFMYLAYFFTHEQRGIKKANNVYQILGFDTTHEEEYEFYTDFFKTKDFKIKYSQLLKVCETKNQIYMYINPKQAFIINKDESIIRLLKEKTNYKKYTK